MANYGSSVLDEIRGRVDLVELVSRFVNLKKAGANWKGLCPFHGEKTPSFMVNPKRGIFHCFGCGVGGDAFGFVMRQDRLSFPEAVRALAKTAGVTLADEPGPRAGESGREELLRVMDLAAGFYVESLWKPSGARARQYLDGRGVDPGVARRFGLGYAPDGWESLATFMRGERVAEETLVTAGLVVPREGKSGVYDRFRGRLLFAIRDLQGRVVAFGGRAFGDEQPKYLNSPETPLYSKGHLLYAADVARERMRERNRALVVEGYLDCLMAHQHGFTETVAALGTAFTGPQLAILRRYCDEVVTFFDADAAGQKAAERAEELLEPTGAGAEWSVTRSGSFEAPGAMRIKVALLPPGHDPDTFLRAEGAAAFEERIGLARSLLAYGLDRIIVDSAGPAGSRAQLHAFARVSMMLAKVPDAQEAAALSQEAARKLGVDPTQLWTEARRLQSALRRPLTPPRPSTPTLAPGGEERALVRLLLHDADARTILLPLIKADELGADAQAIVMALKARPDTPAQGLLTELDDSARSLLTALVLEEDRRFSDNPQASIAGFQRHLERAQRLRRIREVSRSIADIPSDPDEAPLGERFLELHRDSASVYEFGGGVPQTLEARVVRSVEQGPQGPQGVNTHE